MHTHTHPPSFKKATIHMACSLSILAKDTVYWFLTHYIIITVVNSRKCLSPPKETVSLSSQSLFIPDVCSPWHLLMYSRSVRICPFWTLYMNEGHITHGLSCQAYSQQVFLRFSHAVACTKTSIHFTTKPFADRGYLTFCLPVN